MSKAFNSNRCTISFMNEIFPELKLKGSEDEKKMKNWILDELRLSYQWAAGDSDRCEELLKAITWLEKQGESMWRDEDEERLQSCIIALQGKGLMGGVDTMDSKWLKSLKQRMG